MFRVCNPKMARPLTIRDQIVADWFGIRREAVIVRGHHSAAIFMGVSASLISSV